MAKLIKCPNCGENNLADMEFCQYCQSRLQPLSGDLQEEGRPLTPGQVPTKKSTGDLEPILPQWLREARNSARQFSEEDSQQAQSPQKTQATPSASSGADLLAGLHSQSDDEEEEIPDWLANITGEKPKPKKSQPESSEVRWVELGGKKDFVQPAPEPEADVPSWLSGMTPSTPPGEQDESTDWIRSADVSQVSQQPLQPFTFDEQPADASQDWLHSMVPDDGMAFNDAAADSTDEPFISSDTPDWLRGLESPTASKDSGAAPAFSDTPDWLKAMDAEAAASKPSTQPAPPPSVSSDTPDWLKAMGGESAAFTPSVQPESSDSPDWLKSMGGESAVFTPGDQPEPSDAPDWLQAIQEESAVSSSSSDMPDWLKAMGDQGQTQGADSTIFAGSGLGESEAVPSPSGEEPDWLKGLESSAPASDQDWLKGIQPTEEKQPETLEKPAQQPAPVSDDAELDIPSWLKAAAPQASIFGEPPAESKEPGPAADAFETPDWLKAFKSVEASESQAASAPLPSEPASPVPPVSTGEPQPAVEADSLFTEMPDWLSIKDDTITPEPVAPITNVDAIAPGDLPSWVQAMRPVDAGIPQSAVSLSSDRTLETNGALAGLQGVLPAAPGFAAVRKPKAHSIKLQASEEQQQHAGLLEQILSAETEPVPIGSSFSMLGTSRVLRWLLSILVFAALTAVLIMRTQVFATPTGFPVEAVSAWNIVKDTVPTDGRVLVIFDYEPARAGEIEAIALPMFDQMMRLHFPRLTFISTNETGLILAERFISSKPLNGIGENGYESGSQYLNLGYLPGGQMGIRAFVENPFGTLKYAAPQTRDILKFAPDLAKAFPPTDGVDSLSQFSALFLLTDDADSARAWIEQTKSARGEIPIPFVVVSSAQAAPMLQPYYASGQINGLASGLYDGALFEQNDVDQSGQRYSNTIHKYWDAYNVGMLLAMALILGGGLISLALGLRDRVAAREAK